MCRDFCYMILKHAHALLCCSFIGNILALVFPFCSSWGKFMYVNTVNCERINILYVRHKKAVQITKKKEKVMRMTLVISNHCLFHHLTSDQIKIMITHIDIQHKRYFYEKMCTTLAYVFTVTVSYTYIRYTTHSH